MSDARSSNGSADGEWRYSVDEVDENGVVRETLEPGSPSLENVVFVLVGVAIALFVVARGIGLV